MEFAEETVKTINHHIEALGFEARDADGQDFQRGTDTGLRFKTGTSHDEVTILPYRGNTQMAAIRILPSTPLDVPISQITALVEQYDSEQNAVALGEEA